jgi:pre-mRNA-splicing helicase BRR2
MGTELLYRPKTRETRAAFEALLSQVAAHFGDMPADVLRGAADEVLAVLKDDRSTDPERKRGVEAIMPGLSNEKFASLVTIGKMITDWVASGEVEAAAAGETLDDDIGVAVEFEEDDDADGDGDGAGMAYVQDEEDDGDDDGRDGGGEGDGGAPGPMDAAPTLAGEQAAGAGGGGDGADGSGQVKVSDIDAYWLQRQVSKACGFGPADAEAGAQMAARVLAALDAADDREAENALVALLDFDKFDLIKLLMYNRHRVLWCTRLARAQDEAEAARIEQEMSSVPELQAILRQLHAQRMTARERQNATELRIREEARRLRSAEAGGNATGVGADDDLMPPPPAPGPAAASGRRVLELDALSFQQGRRLMANKRCELPAGSFRSAKKGYEEVHVPALKPKPFADDEALVQISDLPEWAQPAFAGMKTLNRVQSRVLDCALFSPENLLLCAPTGAGKTNVAVLTIMHCVGMHRREDGSLDTGAFKIVYVAPMKALVAEIVGNLGTRLAPFGIKVAELTGDVSLSKSQLEETQVIVTTPEKWDIITRKSGDRTYTQLVRLLIIDEIHLLHDDRGPVLESIVARTVRNVEATQELTRMVGLSATLPNYADVAAFLRVDPPKGLHVFDNSFRPCPLQQQYIGVSVKKALQRFQLMNEICYEKVLECAGKHQVLVFVHSRKDTAKTCRFLRDAALNSDALPRFLKEDSASREVLADEVQGVRNADLRDVLPHGFAIHHAGMARSDRQLVEDLFADGHVQVLVSTATLAWGVNLPAHTVIIKGTQVYNPEKGGWDELSPMDVMQMMGRAGRPQFDTHGEGIIITQHSELQFYLSLFNQQLPVESQLVSRLADALNAECVLGTVTSVREATAWLGYTYLFVRMLRNPTLYGIGPDAVDSDPRLEGRRADLVHTAALQLDRAGLLRYDRRSGALAVTDLGRIGSHYYVTHSTVAAFNGAMKPHHGEIELCRLFAMAEEFKHVSVREEEKVELARLLERVPIPVKEALDEPAAKVNVLLQAYISGLKLDGFALAADMVYITQSAGRLLRCLFEIALRRGWAGVTEKALALCKMAQRRLWASQTPLRQFKGVPADVIMKVERKDLPWERWADLSSQEVGELIRLPKMGKPLHKLIHQFPRLELAATVQPITRSVLRVDLTVTPDFQWDDKVHGFVEPWWVLVQDGDQETILHAEYFLLKAQFAAEDAYLSFTVPLQDPLPPVYFIRLVSDRWLGAEAQLAVSFRHLLLPEKNPPPVELLDLQPLPVSALRKPAAEKALFASRFRHFNPVQTQVFSALYNSDDNVLVAAPTGSGKTVCAEFALLRLLRDESSTGGGVSMAGRVVYCVPGDALAHERFVDWSATLGRGLGLTVVELTGEGATDLKLLERGNVVVTTPERWDMLSRRWRQRKAVQQVALFIADELHLVGGQAGPCYEVVVSRMRYIAAQTGTPIRVVGLSTSLANATDLGDWIGAAGHNALFNFSPGVRPVPLDIHITGVDVLNFDSRMQAMARPVYAAICTHAAPSAGAEAKPAIVFVPTRKHAKLAALDLLTLASSEGTPHRFLHASPEDIAPLLSAVRDSAVRHALSYGVALLHEGLLEAERAAVEALFEAGAAGVLVATAPLCWGLSVSASLVVVMGTQYYDSTRAAGAADYPVTDLLQMLGRAGRPGQDARGCAVLLCHAPRKNYYKRFLFEPFPVESHLDQMLHDHICAEVVTRTIESKQDAVDYLTWTFYYRRLTQNPNYYNLTGTSHRHLSDHLSNLVESVLSDLEQSKCIAFDEEDDTQLVPLNLGIIAGYYYISYTTMELFAASLTAKTKLKGVLEVLCAASEFAALPMRPGEEETVRRILTHAHLAVEDLRSNDPASKANALLQAHFSRRQVGGDLALDQRRVLLDASRLLQAIADVISSSGWLAPALAAMELSQMVSQGMWNTDPLLLQLPHVSRDAAQRAAGAGMESVFDLVDADAEQRAQVLAGLNERQQQDVAAACNRYPSIEVSFDAPSRPVAAGEAVALTVGLEREMGDDDTLGPVIAPRYPKPKEEAWWLVVGSPKRGTLAAIKRVTLARKAKVKLEFAAPADVEGPQDMALYFMCDSYLGCDQQFDFVLDVTAAADDEDDEQGGAADAMVQ